MNTADLHGWKINASTLPFHSSLRVSSDSIFESAFCSPATTMTATNLSKEKISPSILSCFIPLSAFSNPTLESARLFTCYHNDESNKPACKKKKKWLYRSINHSEEEICFFFVDSTRRVMQRAAACFNLGFSFNKRSRIGATYAVCFFFLGLWVNGLWMAKSRCGV